MDLSAWGEDTRLISGREHPHPGAQLSLFDTSEGFRHTCFITKESALNFDAAVLEFRQRGNARVEDRVRCWKDCGLQNLPFASFTQNLTWVATSLVVGALIAWAQMICLDGELKKAEPKTIRYRILHVAAVLVRRGRRLILRLDETWPWAGALRRAFLRLRTRSHNTLGPAPDPTTVILRGRDVNGQARGEPAPDEGLLAQWDPEYGLAGLRRRPRSAPN